VSNLFIQLPALAQNGPGTPVDVSDLASLKTVVITGSWRLTPNITIEINLDPAMAGGWAPLETFQGAGMQTFGVVAYWMRARVSNFKGGQAPEVWIGADTDLVSFAAMAAPAGAGSGAAVDISALPPYKTVQVSGVFQGQVNIEISEDGGTSWATAFSFGSGQAGFQNASLIADFMRVKRVGVPTLAAGTPVVNVGATTVPGGGGPITVENNGVDIGNFKTLDFTDGLTATDVGGGAVEIKSNLGWFNVLDYGAIGNGTTDDTAAINSAIAAATPTINGVYGGIVYFPKGTYLVSSTISIPNGVCLKGEGPPTTIIKAANAFNAASLVKNTNQNGTQEFAFVEGLQLEGNKGGGAICSTAVLDFGSLFINSYIRDVVIADASNVGLRIAATAAMGPILVENVWVVRSNGHNILVEEAAGNVGACAGICFVNVTTEHQATGKAALYLKGLGSATGWNFFNIHIEMQNTGAGTTGITIDGVSRVLLNGVQLQAAAPGSIVGISILNVAQNVGLIINNVTNINLINPVINDAKNGIRLAGVNIPIYYTPDISVTGGLRVQGDVNGIVNPFVARNQAGADILFIDKDGRVSGTSPSGAGIDLVGDAANDRPVALVNHAKNRVFGWSYPDASNLRLSYFTGGVSLLQFSTSGLTFIYNESIFLGNSIRQGSAAGVAWKSGAGSPEGVVTAPVGSIYSRTDGGAGTSLYVKESGVGNTGWLRLVGV